MMGSGVVRRRFLAGAGAALGLGALGGCGTAPTGRDAGARLSLPPLRVSADRITGVTVCTRPFRAQGPRIEVERVGDKAVVHHYGHGGSGWSLSWGSGAVAAEMALKTGASDIAVIGCGAIGLTTALVLQRMGAAVTIYAKELPPDVPSAEASGVWSPDSRICMEAHATPAFKAQWERMCRRSFQVYQDLLGVPDTPVEWIDSYSVLNAAETPRAPDPRPKFAHLRRELVPDLSPAPESYAPGNHPFGDKRVRRHSFMMFNIAPYFRLLMSDFLAFGGRVQVQEFHSPAEFAELPQETLVNCTGYGARALFGDRSVIPVRGQLAHVIPQQEIRYGLYYDQVSFVPRRDGMIFQHVGPDDYHGYGDETTTPDRAESERAVETIAGLFRTA